MMKNKILIITGILFIDYLVAQSRQPKIIVKDKLPMNYNALTLPPFGIYISEKEKDNPQLLQHELTHWRQYQKTGAILFGLVDLSNVNLSNAYLRGTDLSYADFKNVILDKAITDKRFIQVSCIGSEKEKTTYCFDDDIIWCGCFKGTLEEFEKKVKETHSNNP